jgi:BMFP domain-containing protein YqiC
MAVFQSAPLWRASRLMARYRGAKPLPSEQKMTFMNSNALDDLARRLAEALPPSVRSFGRDLESNFKAVLQAQLAKLDLVNRTEFDVQAALLARTQAALAAMEQRLKDLEAKLTP